MNLARKELESTPRERFVSRQVNHSYKIEEVIKRRQVLLVQVERDARREDAGVRLTTFLSIPGRYVVLTASDPRKAVSREINPKNALG